MEQPFRLNFLSWILISVSLFAPIVSFSQQTIFVFNGEKDPLVGVNVYIQKESFYAHTDVNGKVVLPSFPDSSAVTFSYLGYITLNLKYSEVISEGKIILEESENLLKEITLIGRSDLRLEDISYQIDIIDKKSISLTNPQTSADALSQHGQVYVQKSQMGGGSPVIRGFEANKLLLVVDGIRMNNAIYRNGHLQNSITIDASMLERMEVIYGPGSLLYGSDALGGVVHFRTKMPKLTTESNYQSVNFFTRYSSANEEKSAHFDVNFGAGKWAFLTGITASEFGNLRSGKNRKGIYADKPDFGLRHDFIKVSTLGDELRNNENPLVQVGTSYKQIDVTQKIRFQPDTHWQITGNIQYSNSSDVPRYDFLSEKRNGLYRFAEWYYGPQKRFMASARVKYISQTKLFDEWSFIGAYQNINEDRISRTLDNDNSYHQEEEVSINSWTVDFLKNLNPFKVFYGGELNFNTVSSNAFNESIISGQKDFNVFTRYPDNGSEMNMWALYFMSKWKNDNNSLSSSAGLRYSGSLLKIKYLRNTNFIWPEDFYAGVKNKNNSITWSYGINWDPISNLKTQWKISTAFRSPNIDDLAKVRVRSTKTLVPNLNLEPEKSINLEATIQHEIANKGFTLTNSLTAFSTHLKNAIVREDYHLPDGSTSMIINGNAYFVQANVNADQADLSGLSLNNKLTIKKWYVTNSLNWISGTSQNSIGEESPLAHIPPFYAKIETGFKLNRNNFSLVWRHNGWKNISDFAIGSSDNDDLALPEGSPKWSTLNVYSRIYLNDNFEITAGIENIFDTFYRPFSSGINGAGRNLILSVRGKF
jgi:hemoglobin/transferrin/lactoferrin receptor protein